MNIGVLEMASDLVCIFRSQIPKERQAAITRTISSAYRFHSLTRCLIILLCPVRMQVSSIYSRCIQHCQYAGNSACNQIVFCASTDSSLSFLISALFELYIDHSISNIVLRRCFHQSFTVIPSIQSQFPLNHAMWLLKQRNWTPSSREPQQTARTSWS